MIQELFRLDGRAAVITGAGRGIGAASAIALAEAGADVVVCARTESQLDEVAKQVAAVGRRCMPIVADLAEPGAAADLAAGAADALGRLDIVVNNVGGAMPKAFLDTRTKDLERAFRFNVGTTHELTLAAVPHLLKHGHGSVINISSAVGRVSGRGYLAYGTAKAALNHYTELAARDLAPRVRVNAIAPGAIATSALEIVVADDNLRQQVEKTTPLSRIGAVADIASAVVYLASDASAYVTGKVLDIDGGIDQPNVDLGLPDLS